MITVVDVFVVVTAAVVIIIIIVFVVVSGGGCDDAAADATVIVIVVILVLEVLTFSVTFESLVLDRIYPHFQFQQCNFLKVSSWFIYEIC